MNKLIINEALSVSIFILISLGPIYWFGSGHVDIIQNIKLIAYVSFLALSILIILTSRKIYHPGYFISFCFYSAFLSTIIVVMRADANIKSMHLLFSLVLPFITFFCIYNLYRLGYCFDRAILTGVVVLASFSILIVSSYFFGFPQWFNPYGEVPGARSLTLTGFGGSRTGWGMGMAIAVPILCHIYLKSGLKEKTLVLLLLTCIFIGLFSTQGRGGLINSALAVTTYFFLNSKRNKYQFIFIVSLLGVAILNIILSHSEYMRLDSLLAGSFSQASGGRTELNAIAFQEISNNIIFGSKPAGIELTHSNLEVHNYFIRLMVHGGLFLLMPTLLLYSYFLIKSFIGTLKGELKEESVLTFSVLCAGLFSTMIEPGGVFGAFYNIQLFWIIIAAYFAKQKLINSSKPRTSISTIYD